MAGSVHVPVAIAHDYLTQAGGAERVVLDLAAAFPGAPIYTTLYHETGTFPEFRQHTIYVTKLNRLAALRADHRLALPFLAPAVSAMTIPADLTIASSSGWAHGFRTAGRLAVYCHAPARWLYQTEKYLGRGDSRSLADRAKQLVARAAVTGLKPWLVRWDRRAAARADVYWANSSVTQAGIRAAYGMDVPVIPPPPALLPEGPAEPIVGLEPGFLLCVARLMPYKNVDVIIQSLQHVSADQVLAVVGTGPDAARLAAVAEDAGVADRVRFLGRVGDPQLRWLYRHAAALVAASFEDFGLTPLEAAGFGKPTVALGAGGYLDTMVDGTTGVLFQELTPAAIAVAIHDTQATRWDTKVILAHAESFSPAGFRTRIREAVGDMLPGAAS